MHRIGMKLIGVKFNYMSTLMIDIIIIHMFLFWNADYISYSSLVGMK